MQKTRVIFIVRLWREPSAPPGEWRGDVQCSESAQAFRFVGQAKFLEYIQAQLAAYEQGDSGHRLEDLDQ